jgi:hypothetical protein
MSENNRYQVHYVDGGLLGVKNTKSCTNRKNFERPITRPIDRLEVAHIGRYRANFSRAFGWCLRNFLSRLPGRLFFEKIGTASEH